MAPVPATPTQDGGYLLAPCAQDLSAWLAAGRGRVDSMEFQAGGLSAPALRQLARQELRRIVGAELPGCWVMTGHQPEMHHPGVWFKDAVIAALASAVNGSAIHVVADLDAAKHPELVVPQAAAGRLTLRRVAYAHPVGPQCPAQLPPPTAATLDELARVVKDCLGEPGVFSQWLDLARRALGRAATLAEWISAARNELDRSLGLDIHDVPLSRLVRGQAWARFAAELIVRHGGMLEVYEESLQAYRRRRGIRNRAQPVADLDVRAGATEVPLWVYRQAQPRLPMRVRPSGGGVELLAGAERLSDVPEDIEAAAAAVQSLAAEGILLAPRALTLTMFLRSFLADAFVHGLGGASYDELGDDLAARWFGWLPPPFAVAAATLRLDLPRHDAAPADLAKGAWQAHYAWHNPREGAHDADPAVDALARERAAVLAAIAAAARVSPARKEAFQRRHELTGGCASGWPGAGGPEQPDRADSDGTGAELRWPTTGNTSWPSCRPSGCGV